MEKNEIGVGSIAFILKANSGLLEFYYDLQAKDLETAIIKTQAPLVQWNGNPLPDNIVKAREKVKVAIVLCSLRTTSKGPMKTLPLDIVKLICSKFHF